MSKSWTDELRRAMGIASAVAAAEQAADALQWALASMAEHAQVKRVVDLRMQPHSLQIDADGASFLANVGIGWRWYEVEFMLYEGNSFLSASPLGLLGVEPVVVSVGHQRGDTGLHHLDTQMGIEANLIALAERCDDEHQRWRERFEAAFAMAVAAAPSSVG